MLCRSHLLVVLLLSHLTGVEVEAAAENRDDAAAGEEALFAEPTRYDRVGRIVAPVMINGRGPFSLLVDTGANSTTLTTRLADELGIDHRNARDTRLNGVTGHAVVPVVSVAHLQAGALIMRDQQMPVVDSRVMADADGILGVAALTDKQLVVDFRRNRVSLNNSRSLPGHLLTVRARRLPTGLLVVPALVGRVQTSVVIDTGAQRTLGNRALQIALNQTREPSATVPVLGTTSHVAEGTQSMVRRIKLGEARIGNSVVTFGDFHVFNIWGLNSEPALILGMDVIGTVGLFIIDFHRLEVGFET